MYKEVKAAMDQAYNNVANVPEAITDAGQSFFLGFAWNVIFSGGSPLNGLVGGAVSTTASVIDSALRPKLTEFFGQDSLYSSLIRNIVVLSSTSLVSAAAAPLVGLSVSFSLLSAMLIRALYAAFAGDSLGRLQLIPVRI